MFFINFELIWIRYYIEEHKKSYELYVIPRSQTDVGVGGMSRDLPYLAKMIPEMFVTSMLWRENINGISLFTSGIKMTTERKHKWDIAFFSLR